MKHKIITQVIILFVMIILAAIIYENAPAIAEAIGVRVRVIDTSALGLVMAGIIPSSIINEIRKEAIQ